MFSNDGSFRRYIAKGPNEWEFFTDSDNLKTQQVLFHQATEANDSSEMLNHNKQDRAIIG